MNWANFKKAVESQKVSDDTKILAIDTSGTYGDDWDVTVTFQPGGILIFANDKTTISDIKVGNIPLEKFTGFEVVKPPEKSK